MMECNEGEQYTEILLIARSDGRMRMTMPFRLRKASAEPLRCAIASSKGTISSLMSLLYETRL